MGDVMSTAILAYFAFFVKLIDQWKQIAANLVILLATNLVSIHPPCSQCFSSTFSPDS